MGGSDVVEEYSLLPAIDLDGESFATTLLDFVWLVVRHCRGRLTVPFLTKICAQR